MGNGFRKFSPTLLTKTLQLSTIDACILHVNLFIVEDHIKLKHFRRKLQKSLDQLLQLHEVTLISLCISYGDNRFLQRCLTIRWISSWVSPI
jgi:hypothetical protein